MLLPVVLYSSCAVAEERCRLFEHNLLFTFAVEMCIHILYNVVGSDVSGDVLGDISRCGIDQFRVRRSSATMRRISDMVWRRSKGCGVAFRVCRSSGSVHAA